MPHRTPVLATPPSDPRAFELWLQHAAGWVLFEQVRTYARDNIDPGLDPAARRAVEKGIDDAVFGLMRTIEGVPRSLQNETHYVDIEVFVRLARIDGGPAPRINLREGDGMCMGYHGWLEGDFGEDPIIRGQATG
jgi:hypothetical protein